MANPRYNDQIANRPDKSGGGSPVKRGVAQKSLPEEKSVGRLGGKKYGVQEKHTAGYPHIKTFVAGDY